MVLATFLGWDDILRVIPPSRKQLMWWCGIPLLTDVWSHFRVAAYFLMLPPPPPGSGCSLHKSLTLTLQSCPSRPHPSMAALPLVCCLQLCCRHIRKNTHKAQASLTACAWHFFSCVWAWLSILKAHNWHKILPRKDEVKQWEQSAAFSWWLWQQGGLITRQVPPLDLDDTFPVIIGNDHYWWEEGRQSHV